MSPSALPLISEQDYPIFQRMIGELRQTSYEEWHEDHTKAIAYRRSRNGFVEIGLSPDEFGKWLTDNNKTGHLELLWEFAEDKAERLARKPGAGGSSG